MGRGFALETAIRALDKPAAELSFRATHSGAEVDLFWQQGGKTLAAEAKYAAASRRTPVMKSAMADLRLGHLWVPDCKPPGNRSRGRAAGVVLNGSAASSRPPSVMQGRAAAGIP